MSRRVQSRSSRVGGATTEDRTDAGQGRDRGTKRCPGDVHRALEHVRNSKREEQSLGLAAPKDMPEWEEDLRRRAGTRVMALGSSRLGCGVPLPISILVPAPLLGMWLGPR